MRRFEEAKACFEKVILIDPDYEDAYYNLAVLYAKTGDVNNAKLNLNRAIQINEEYNDYAKEEEVFKNMIEL